MCRLLPSLNNPLTHTLSKVWSEVDWEQEAFIPAGETGEERASAQPSCLQMRQYRFTWKLPTGSVDPCTQGENSSENLKNMGEAYCQMVLMRANESLKSTEPCLTK